MNNFISNLKTFFKEAGLKYNANREVNEQGVRAKSSKKLGARRK